LGPALPLLAPDQISSALTADDWEAQLIGSVTQAADAQGSNAGTELAEFGIAMMDGYQPIAGAYGSNADKYFEKNVSDAIVGAAKGLANAYDELTLKDLAPLFALPSSISRIKLNDIVHGILSVLSPTGSRSSHIPDLAPISDNFALGYSITTAAP